MAGSWIASRKRKSWQSVVSSLGRGWWLCPLSRAWWHCNSRFWTSLNHDHQPHTELPGCIWIILRLPTDDLILRECSLDDFIRCYCVLHGFVHSGWVLWKAKTFTRYVLESCRMSTISSTKDRFRIKNNCTQGICCELLGNQTLPNINL